MKIDRRRFLSLGIGAAAGTALSPLPWKITDDLSIWTQMWPWTPVPEDGKASDVKSTCTLCPAGCGISVRKINNRAVKIEGDKGNPINDGGICILGLSGLQLLYGPSRITSPVKRIGKRGEGKFEPITWKQAIAELAEKLASLRSQEKPHTVACISGTKTGTVAELFKRFLTAYGSPNFMHVPSMADSYEQTVKMMHGVDAAVGVDAENADYILSFSSGILDGWGSPVRMFKANSRIKAIHGKTIQIESRMSRSAAKADKWIPIAPGTEAVFVLGLCYVIIQESLYDRLLVDAYSTGFDAFKRYVLAGYSPDKVAAKTGVEPSVIISLARDFAHAKAPLALCGRGRGDIPGALGDFVAVHALNALVGNINRKGGVWTLPNPDYIRWSRVYPDDVAVASRRQKRIDAAGKGMQAGSLLNQLPAMLNTESAYGLEVLLISGANPLYTLPDAQSLESALEKTGLIVNFSSYMDETARYSDLILPNHAYLERFEDVTAGGMFTKPYLGLARPVVKPLYNTRHTGDVILETAKAMKGPMAAAFPWPSYESCLRQTMGYKWTTMVKNGYWLDPGYRPPDWPEAFMALAGPFNFSASVLKPPVFIEPEGDADAFPLILIPYDSIRLTTTGLGNPPFMTKTVPDTVLKGKDIFIEIHPDSAKELGLADGKTAELTTPKGKARVKVHISHGIGPGVIAMARGLGHSTDDRYLAGKGVNVNRLIGPISDPVSGLDAAWGIRAKLVKS